MQVYLHILLTNSKHLYEVEMQFIGKHVYVVNFILFHDEYFGYFKVVHKEI